MKKLLWSLALIPSLTVSVTAQVNEAPRFEIVERGDHHRVWQSVTTETDAKGRIHYRTNSYTELGTGMHYFKDGQWLESREEIEIVPDGAIARHGRHQVIFAANCNAPIGIDMLTPDGKRLQSRVLGLAYFDSVSGRMVWIAELKDSVGQLLPPNQVIYIDAFTGFKAHLRYTYTKAGFEQDVIIREKPPAPAKFGMNPATTRLQVMTEFLNPPTPKRVARSLGGIENLSDETVDFDDMKMTSGRAFSLLGQRQDRNPIPVAKSWGTLDGRTFLVEEVPFSLLEPILRSLPTPQASLNAPDGLLHAVSTQRRLPTAQLPKPTSEGMKLASAPLSGPGVVLDYTIVSGGTTYVFKGDTTYYVNGDARFTGNVTIEGGAVIKFSSTNYASVTVDGGSITCQTSAYRPAIFTSRNDNTVGETIAGSTGTPAIDTQGNYNLIISSTNQTTLQYLRVSYCYCGVTAVNGSLAMSHVQFVHTDYPIYIVNTTQCSVRNALMYDVTQVAFEVFNAAVSVEHLTVDGCAQLGVNDFGATMTLTNSLLVGVSSMGNLPCTTNSVVTTNVTVFQTLGAAGHYLADNTYRNAGTTNINASLAADLRKLTTYPPVELTNDFTTDTTLTPQAGRDADLPDIGYHYDPIDYVVSGRQLTNAVLTLANGVALGTYGSSSTYGIKLLTGSSLVSTGMADNLNSIVRYNTVQEQANTNWTNSTVAPAIKKTVDVPARFRFTRWSVPGGVGKHFDGSVISATPTEFTDCQFGGGEFAVLSVGLGLTNCLWERVAMAIEDDHENMAFSAFNNLVRGGSLSLIEDKHANNWLLKDNFFDQPTITTIINGSLTHDYNGYVTNANRLPSAGANDKVLTNAPVYLTSTLGRYYYPTNGGLLSVLLGAGSRTANNAGLYHYTVTTNQVKETNSTVDIGFHYVATTSSVPADSDSDGIPDYLEDTNGNGSVDSGETDWSVYNSPNGLSGGSGLQVFTPLK